MNLAELIARYRVDANDKVEPYFVSDEELAALLNDALHEACIRGRLLHESQDQAVCRIDVLAGQAVYPLHPALYELTHLAFYPEDLSPPCMLSLKSTEQLDGLMPDWRVRSGRPVYAVQDDTTLRLVPKPDIAGPLILEGYRLPVAPMELASKDTDKPEINESHHVHLVQWALHRAFSIPDMELFDPNRAAIAEAAFTGYFGLRPDSDLRRITREDQQHHVEPFWP